MAWPASSPVRNEPGHWGEDPGASRQLYAWFHFLERNAASFFTSSIRDKSQTLYPRESAFLNFFFPIPYTTLDNGKIHAWIPNMTWKSIFQSYLKMRNWNKIDYFKKKKINKVVKNIRVKIIKKKKMVLWISNYIQISKVE